MECEIAKHEALEEFIEYVKGFIKQEDGKTLDDQLEKLEALKKLLEPEKGDDTVFDELIEKIKHLELPWKIFTRMMMRQLGAIMMTMMIYHLTTGEATMVMR